MSSDWSCDILFFLSGLPIWLKETMFSINYMEKFAYSLPPNWCYRGEGNSSLVISLPKSKQILRIRKVKRCTFEYLKRKTMLQRLFIWISDLFFWYFGMDFEKEQEDVKFYMNIMRPLFGASYVSEAKQVFLQRDQLDQLEDDVERQRPEERKHKMLDFQRATLFDDFTYFSNDYLPFALSNDTFAFEIKPKQGWQPSITSKTPKCLFCMNQYLKKDNLKITQHSEYCPKELFSGHKSQIRKALQGLINTPQNNFRVFKNGGLVYDDKTKPNFMQILHQLFDTSSEQDEELFEAFFDLMKVCLTRNLVAPRCGSKCDQQLLCKWNSQLKESTLNYDLEQDSVLERILSVQMLNTEGTDYYNNRLKQNPTKDWRYVKKLMREVNKYPDTCLKCVMLKLGETQDKDLLFVPYLLAAVANDCSLMIALKKINERVDDGMGVRNLVHTKFGSFVVRIGIFDLYPKPVSTITKHVARNLKVMQAFIRRKSVAMRRDVDHLGTFG